MGPSPSCLIRLGHAHTEVPVTKQQEDRSLQGAERPPGGPNAQRRPRTSSLQIVRKRLSAAQAARSVGLCYAAPADQHRKEQSTPQTGVSGAACHSGLPPCLSPQGSSHGPQRKSSNGTFHSKRSGFLVLGKASDHTHACTHRHAHTCTRTHTVPTVPCRVLLHLIASPLPTPASRNSRKEINTH